MDLVGIKMVLLHIVRLDIFKAALQENKRIGLRSACHHAQMDVASAITKSLHIRLKIFGAQSTIKTNA